MMKQVEVCFCFSTLGLYSFHWFISYLQAMSVDSDDNIPVVRKRKDEEAENRKPFVNEMP